jgi:arylsulfatase A-like enzyme
MGCHGHPYIQTPHLDAFSEQCFRFDQYHTGTTCAPTRAGILTGHHCNSTGVWHTIGGRSLLRKDEWTLATALQENGYRTGLFGKWHLGDDYPYRPQDRGFERVVCHGGGGISQQPDHWGNDYFDDTYQVDGEQVAHTGYCTDVFFSRGLEFIEQHQHEPFFCMISTNAPHGPFNVDPKYRNLYLDETEHENYARFLGMITNLDENFGILREKLQEWGLEDNTILIFMSDNGQTGGTGPQESDLYNADMRGLKGSPYDGGHRVPFFLRWPAGDVLASGSTQILTSYIDIMPTLLDLCGVEVPEERTFHGQSLKPLLQGREDSPLRSRTLVTDTQRVAHPLKWRLSCVMRDNWRLVNKGELYHLAEDPRQQRNIAADQPELVRELQEAYEIWWDLCSKQQRDEIPISIGAPDQEVAVLRTHDLRNEQDNTGVWDQSQVRAGDRAHGWWEVMVEKQGTYEFDLRRWPEEAGHRVGDAISGFDVPVYEEGIEPESLNRYRDGVALEIDTAGLMISGVPELWVPVNPDEMHTRFQASLQPGPCNVRAQFSSSASGFYSSAYYVYVKRLGP